MSDCWKCGEQLDGYGNYCTECGAPQSAKMAVQSFHYDTKDFKRGLNGLLDLLDGCPEMLAEGLAEDERYGDVSAGEWIRRFEDPYEWVETFLIRLWLSHYGISVRDAKQFLDEHSDEYLPDETREQDFPKPENENCGCGASLPTNAPSIVTQWKEATESMAVCFDCFGEISSKISTSG